MDRLSKIGWQWRPYFIDSHHGNGSQCVVAARHSGHGVVSTDVANIIAAHRMHVAAWRHGWRRQSTRRSRHTQHMSGGSSRVCLSGDGDGMNTRARRWRERLRLRLLAMSWSGWLRCPGPIGLRQRTVHVPLLYQPMPHAHGPSTIHATTWRLCEWALS